MSENNKKNKGREAKVATAQTDCDFDDMLAEAREADLTSPNVIAATTTQMRTSALTKSTKDWEKAFIRAVCAGDLVKLRRLARQGVRVQTFEPLYTAAGNGLVSVARFLVKELGADVNK
jgi:hypothetical protein